MAYTLLCSADKEVSVKGCKYFVIAYGYHDAGEEKDQSHVGTSHRR